jgi:predicted Zn-dependent protease
MSAGLTSLAGLYFDGRQPVPLPATLVFSGRDASLISATIAKRFPSSKLKASPRIGRADRFIALPDGGQFQCTDNPLLNRLRQEIRSEGPVSWLEQRLSVAIGAIAIIVALLSGGYFYGLPALAEQVAAAVPIEKEAALGAQAMTWLDKHWFEPTKIEPQVEQDIRERFAALHAGSPMDKQLRLEFRSGKHTGANAFALPGGTIVITDEMIKLAKSRDEVMAVLAHEIGHVEHRHSMRQLLQGSAIALAVSAITADAASLTVAVAGAPALLAQAKYSREFETESDEHAFKLLKKHGISPAAFATLMERLGKDDGEIGDSFAFLSSHPVTAERVKRARAAAE